MVAREQDVRDKIIQAAIELLGEVSDVEKVTVRQVAERADVAIGSINYHFKSRDNLLSIAVGDVMAKMASSFVGSSSHSPLDPATRLKVMIQELYSFGESIEKLVQYLITQTLLNGDMEAHLYLVPTLREIFLNRKDEMELRIISLQILLPIQVASLNPSAFHFFSGIDLHNIEQRNKYIDTLVDNLVSKEK